MKFQNECGVDEGGFLELLRFYLSSTYVVFEGVKLLQKDGVCIGTSVAPVLSDLFLAKCDRDIKSRLDEGVLRVFRYVDDYLVLFRSQASSERAGFITKMFDIFKTSASGLTFTSENPVAGTLQFLDLKLLLQPSHVCWFYCPRAKKGVLPFDSSHSKVIKRGIASTCLRSSLQKSCPHKLAVSFMLQVTKLEEGGFPPPLLAGVAEGLLKKLRGGGECGVRDKPKSRPAVIPYVHKVSHRIKKVGEKHGVPVLLSAPQKLSKLCGRVARGDERVGVCHKNHKTRYVECKEQVVYKIPLSCGKVYIGQSGRCINDRLREHALSVRSSPSGNLAVHCNRCGCVPRLDNTVILTRNRDKKTREISEAFFILKYDQGKCVSAPSVNLYSSEVAYLKSFERVNNS